MNTEPVAWSGALSLLFGSVLTLLNVFGITHWTPDQYTAVTATWSALLAFVLVVFVRNKVTPNVNVPLNKQHQ